MKKRKLTNVRPNERKKINKMKERKFTNERPNERKKMNL